MKDFVIFMSVVIFGVSLLISIIFSIAALISYNSCKNTAELYKMEWTWGPLIECQVKFKDKWVPLTHYRAFEEVTR